MQSLLEQRIDFPGHAQHNVVGGEGASVLRRFQDELNLGLVDEGIIGATLTLTGIPASVNVRVARRRLRLRLRLRLLRRCQFRTGPVADSP